MIISGETCQKCQKFPNIMENYSFLRYSCRVQNDKAIIPKEYALKDSY